RIPGFIKILARPALYQIRTGQQHVVIDTTDGKFSLGAQHFPCFLLIIDTCELYAYSVVTLYRDVGFRYTLHVHPRFKCTGCTLDCGVINLIPFIKRIYLIEDFEAPLQVETEIHILHDVLQSKTDYCKKNDGNHE